MQIEKTENVVKSEVEKTVVTYKCQLCGFTDAGEYTVKRHYADTHLVARKLEFNFALQTCDDCSTGTNTIYWINSKEDLEEWLSTQSGDVHYAHWIRPGWYYLSYHTEPGPWSSENSCINAKHIEVFFAEVGSLIDKFNETINVISTAIVEAGPGKEPSHE